MWSAMLFRATIRVNPRQVAPASLPASDEEEFANFTKRPRTHQSVSSDLCALSVAAVIPKGWCRRRGSNPHGLAATGF